MSKLISTFGLLFAAISVSASAQTVKLPDHDAKCENLAYGAQAAITSAIPAAVEMKFLSPVNEENVTTANDMINYAHQFIGTRYRRGGKTPGGFDCSGFTGYVFRQFGYDLGASSRDQYNDGQKIETSEIQPGDLLFFTGRASRSSRVGHVGIAIDADPSTGEITFIHASCTGGIRIDRTTDRYYASRFLGARRVIGAM